MPAGGLAIADPTPRDRLVGLSESIRDALTVQFGSSCRAKTTEELAVDEKLAQLLGEEGFRELIAFLDRIDLLKFAPERSDNHAGELEELLDDLGGPRDDPRCTDSRQAASAVSDRRMAARSRRPAAPSRSRLFRTGNAR